MHRWCPVMLNALSKSFTCSLILILILILILKRSPRSLVRASLRTMVVCFEKSLVIECISVFLYFCVPLDVDCMLCVKA